MGWSMLNISLADLLNIFEGDRSSRWQNQNFYIFLLNRTKFFLLSFYSSWEYTFMHKLLLLFDDTLIGRFWYIAGSSYEMVMVWIFCQQVIQISCLFSIDVFLWSMSKKFNAIEIWEYLCQGLTAWSIARWLTLWNWNF